MFSDQPTILSSELNNSSNNAAEAPLSLSQEPSPLKKILLIAGLVIFGLALVAGIYFAVKALNTPKAEIPKTEEPVATTSELTNIPTTLPNLNPQETATTTIATSSFSNLAIEYLSFADFYKIPDNNISVKLNDYEFPLNVKIDVMNYYDVSRKLNLDPGLSNLNAQGFTTIDNPYSKDATDFVSVYSSLDTKQLPLLVTSDFMIYYYQNILKKAFKDVEENVFYENLWDINKELYGVAKTRYEAHLAAIGNINDTVLEGERLETAYFAVALELLKPTADQLSGAEISTEGGFTTNEIERFVFVTPPYLKEDVMAEVKLIRAAAGSIIKSPVMLYNRDYSEFVLPKDYKSNAKLKNFYITTAWLNSVFPLNYRSKDCPTCLLDAADWRINMTAASFMAKDFSELPGLKNKWARIYKVMSYFKGLRDDLNYVHYRDSLTSVFGNDYKIEELFDDANKNANANLEKLRAKALSYNFAEISGAYSKTDSVTKPRLGFKLLAESYWPNSYIFSRLTSPAVGGIIATTTQKSNVTFCLNKRVYTRCNGIALDPVELVYPIENNSYFKENTDYVGYSRAVSGLQTEMAKAGIGHINGYWSNLSLIKSLLSMNKANLPNFARSTAWQDKSLRTAAGAWINLQIPLEKFTTTQIVRSSGLNNTVRWNENSYVEPNLDLINDLLANTAMMTQMFSALQLDTEVRLALQDMKNFSSSLEEMKAIVIKELTGEALTALDNEAVANFTKQLNIDPGLPKDKQITIKLPKQTTILREDLSQLKLLVIVHQEGNNKIFSVGPVWDYQEGR